MAVYITEKDYEKLGITPEVAKGQVDYYRSQGLSDEDIQSKIDAKTGRVIPYNPEKIQEAKNILANREKSMEDVMTSPEAKVVAGLGSFGKMATFGLSNLVQDEGSRDMLAKAQEANPWTSAAGTMVGAVASPLGSTLNKGASAITATKGAISKMAGRFAANAIEDQIINKVSQDNNDMLDVLGASAVGSVFGEALGAGAKLIRGIFGGNKGASKQVLEIAKRSGKSPKDILNTINEVEKTGNTSLLMDSLIDMNTASGQRLAKAAAEASPDEFARIAESGLSKSKKYAQNKSLELSKKEGKGLSQAWDDYLGIQKNIKKISDDIEQVSNGGVMAKNINNMVDDINYKTDKAYKIGVDEATKNFDPIMYESFLRDPEFPADSFKKGVISLGPDGLIKNNADVEDLLEETPFFKSQISQVPEESLNDLKYSPDNISQAKIMRMKEYTTGQRMFSPEQLNDIKINLLNNGEKMGNFKARETSRKIDDFLREESPIYAKASDSSNLLHQVKDVESGVDKLLKDKEARVLNLSKNPYTNSIQKINDLNGPNVPEAVRKAANARLYDTVSNLAGQGDFKGIKEIFESQNVKDIFGESTINRAKESLAKEVDAIRNFDKLAGIKGTEHWKGLIGQFVNLWRFAKFGFQSMGAASFLNDVLGKDMVQGFSKRAYNLLLKSIDPNQSPELAIDGIRKLLKNARSFDNVEQKYIVNGLQRIMQKAAAQGESNNE